MIKNWYSIRFSTPGGMYGDTAEFAVDMLTATQQFRAHHPGYSLDEIELSNYRTSSSAVSVPSEVQGNRPSWDRTWMDIVNVMARRGTCVRRQVAAVIVTADNKLLSTGYNGVASGVPHCNKGYPCETSNAPSGMELDGCDAVHAEINALISCSNIGIARTMYVSVECCIDCTKALLNTPIKRIVYEQPYAKSGRNLWLKWNTTYNVPRMWQQLLPGEDHTHD